MVRDHYFELLTADVGRLLRDISCRVAPRRTLESPSPNEDRNFYRAAHYIATNGWFALGVTPVGQKELGDV